MLLAIFAGTIGSVLGGLAWYYVGQVLGLARIRTLADRHGKWLGISSKEVVATQQWFSQRGYWAIGLGRLVPGIRTYISVPAGIANMPMFQFLTYSTVGSLAWTTLLTLSGFWLGASYEKVGAWLGPISKLVLISLAVVVIARILSQLKKNL